MPRGKYTSHKGKNRRFTNPEELKEERRKEEQQRKWRQQRGELSSSEEEGGEEQESEEGSSEEESESESEEETPKAKGVSNLIEIENPNRIQKKPKKVSALTTSNIVEEAPQLSRKEKEEIQKQQAAAHYQKLHAEGKTEEARADLARLAIIKQQREEARIKREQERKMKEEAVKQKTAQTQKALGKK